MVVGRWKAKGGKKYTLKKKWMLKTITKKIKNKKDNYGNADLVQQERSNNKCYASIYIYIYM